MSGQSGVRSRCALGCAQPQQRFREHSPPVTCQLLVTGPSSGTGTGWLRSQAWLAKRLSTQRNRQGKSCAFMWQVECLNQKGELYLKRGKLNAADALEIAVDDAEEGTVLRLRGRVNFESSPALRDRLLAMLRGQAPTAVIVDLVQVPYIDSSGIATLIEGLKIARNRQIAFCLQGLQGRLLHLFEVTGVLALFIAGGCIVRPVEKVS